MDELNMEQNENRDVLIVRFLSGEANQNEIKLLKDWIAQTPSHQAYFESFERTYYSIPPTERSFDTVAAWELVHDRMQPKGRIIEWSSWRTWAAASVVILMGCASWFIIFNKDKTPYVSGNQRLEQIIPNGTRLTLDVASSANYAEDDNAAWIELTGDGYFDVADSSTKEFFVKTEEVLIKDIGTSFYVRNRPEEDTMYFSVDEGSIICFAGHADSLLLKKGERGYYCRTTRKLGRRPQSVNPNESSFATGLLVFDQSSMSDVVQQLQGYYQISIQVEDIKMLDCSISVEFNQLPIEEVLEIIGITLGWQFERSGHGWILRGNPCQQNF
jgi:transmembrane sensor